METGCTHVSADQLPAGCDRDLGEAVHAHPVVAVLGINLCSVVVLLFSCVFIV